MDQSRGLLANGFHDARMGMPQGIYPQSGHEIEITLSLEIIEKYARAALKDNRVTSVGLQQEAPFTINDPLSVAHSRKDCNCRAKWPEPCFEWCSLGQHRRTLPCFCMSSQMAKIQKLQWTDGKRPGK